MKKLVLFSLIMLGMTFSAVGYVDTLEILQSYNKAIAAQADLVQKQQDVQDFFTLKQKEYERFVSPESTDEEILLLRKRLEEEVEPKRQELLELNKNLSKVIENDILLATEVIAKQLRLEVVVDKKSVLYGGMDITNFVINKLNNINK